jgi:hypothetical protein
VWFRYHLNCRSWIIEDELFIMYSQKNGSSATIQAKGRVWRTVCRSSEAVRVAISCIILCIHWFSTDLRICNFRMTDAVRVLLECIGEDPSRDGLLVCILKVYICTYRWCFELHLLEWHICLWRQQQGYINDTASENASSPVFTIVTLCASSWVLSWPS